MRTEKPTSLAVQTDDRTGCEHGTHTTWDYIQSQGQAVNMVHTYNMGFHSVIGTGCETWDTYNMRLHSVIRENKVITFTGNLMEPEIIILSNIIQT